MNVSLNKPRHKKYIFYVQDWEAYLKTRQCRLRNLNVRMIEVIKYLNNSTIWYLNMNFKFSNESTIILLGLKFKNCLHSFHSKFHKVCISLQIVLYHIPWISSSAFVSCFFFKIDLYPKNSWIIININNV